MASFWRSRKRRELSWWLAVPLVIFAAGAAIVPRVGWPVWATLILAIVCAAGAGAFLFAKERAKASDVSAGIRQQSMRTNGPDGANAPIAKTIPLSTWGVHESLVGVPYLERDAEDEVIAAFEEQQPVLVLGDSMAGKTRMASKLIQELYPNRPVIVPDVPDGVATIMNAGETPQESVIWLDDLERFLADPKNLKTKWIEDLQEADNVIIATMRESFYEGFQPSKELSRTQWQTLRRFRTVRLKNDSEERRKLAAKSPIPRISEGILKYGLGTYVGGGFLAIERLETGRTTNPIGAALVCAAIDWQRSGISDTIPEATALALVDAYIEESDPRLAPEDMASGRAWATDRAAGGGAFRLLTQTEEGAWRPFDYLVDHFALSGKPLPNRLWNAVAQADASAGRLNNAGLIASFAGEGTAATTLFERAAALGDPEAMANLATNFARQDRLSEAEELHRQSADAGSAHGMTGLGVLLLRRGNIAEAESLFRQAAITGDGDAMANLGFILMRRGDTAEGTEWYRCSANAGSGLGMTNYGMQLERSGRTAEAEALYRAAMSRRNGAGMYQLARLLAGEGKTAEIEVLLQQAVELDNPAAMSWLAAIEDAKGEHDEAKRLYAKAADRDDAVGLAVIGKAMTEQGQYEEAEKLLIRSANHGLTFGIHCLGVFLARTGRLEEAKVQYGLAIADGDIQSMVNLGALLWDEDEKLEAEALFWKAADLGSTQAMCLLAEELSQQGKEEAAGDLLKKAASLGDSGAITELGKKATEREDYLEAVRLFQRAAEMGHSYAAECLNALRKHLQEEGRGNG